MNYQLDQVIEVLLSADNQRRIQAEQFVNNLPKTNFEGGLDQFMKAMNHPNVQIATMAALLLKKKYLDIKENFNMISQEKLQMILKTAQTLIEPSKPLLFLKRCCEIIIQVFNSVNQKKDLMNTIQTLSKSDSPNIKLCLMYFIEIICESIFDDNLLMQSSGIFQAIFSTGMEDSNNEVRVASFKTLTIFLSCIENETMVKKFDSVLTILMKKAIDLIKYDQQSGITAISSLNELIQSHPNFMKPVLNDLLMIYAEIMAQSGLLVNLRITAMHGVFLMTTNHAAAIRKNQYFKQKMPTIYMKMLSENQTTPVQQWAQELNEQVISKNDISLSTQEHISQMSSELGNKFMLPLFIGLIQEALQSSNTCHQHAGLISMAVLTENCHQSFKGQLKNIMGLLLPLLETQHPRIIHDILVAIGYLSEQFSPDMQTNYGDMILTFITKALAHKFPKVQFKAVQCIQNFQNGLRQHEEVKVMQPHLDNILTLLGTIFESSLKSGNFFMLQATLDSISTIASLNPFAKYYVTFMPGLKKIISMVGTDTTQKIMARSKAVETMGYLLASVKDNKQLFMPDCKQIMQSLITLTSKLEKDDPLHRATFVVYENVLDSLKGDFVIYSDHIFPFVIEAANRKVDVTIIDQTQTEKPMNTKLNQFVKLKLDLKMDGVKNIVLNTDSLEQKLEATVLLACMAEDMGSEFCKYMEQTIPTINSLMSFKNSKEVRMNVIKTAKYMLQGCTNQQQKLYIIQNVLPPLYEELTKVIRTKDHVQMNLIVQVFAEMMPFMSEQMKGKMPQVMVTVMNSVKSLTKQIQKVYADKDMDQVLQQQMADQISEVEEVYENIEKIMKMGSGKMQFDNLKNYFPKEYEFEA